jgi:hypothetical protein
MESPSDFTAAVIFLTDELNVDTIFPMVDASVMLLADAVPASSRPAVIAATSRPSHVKLRDKRKWLRDLRRECPALNHRLFARSPHN